MEASVTGILAEPFAASGPLSDWGYGVSLSVGARRAPLPLSFGAEIAGVHWGSQTVPVLLELGDTLTPAQVAISHQTMFLDAWLRAQPTRGRVRPYVELVGGLKLIDTAYSLHFPGGSGVTSVFDETTPASTLGLGLGADLLLVRQNDDPDAGLFINLGLRKLWGNHVSLKHPTYGTFQTDTNTVLVSLGFAVKSRLAQRGRP
jgi:hypothetical protein